MSLYILSVSGELPRPPSVEAARLTCMLFETVDVEHAQPDSLFVSCRQVRIPGFSGSQVKPYKRVSAKEMHTERVAAIRKETAAGSTVTTQK